jgi:hypothetical protein
MQASLLQRSVLVPRPTLAQVCRQAFAAQRTCASLNRNDFQSTSTPTLIINAAYLRYFFVQLK